MSRLPLSLIISVISLIPILAQAGLGSTQCGGHAFQHVVTVVLENADYEEAARAPFLAGLAATGATLTNYHGVTHPSQGNYFALMSGSIQGAKTDDSGDDNMNVNGPHLGDQLENAGKDWRVYAENYPGNCFLGADSGLYVRKHTPFLSFKNIQSDKRRCAKIVNSNQFDQDVKQGKLPAYSLYVPNLKNDGHDPSGNIKGVDFAGNWVRNRFSSFLQDSAAMNCTLFVVVFDEAEEDSDGTNHIYGLMYGPMIEPRTVINQQLNHYSLLRLIQENFGLKPLLGNAASAPSFPKN